MGGKAFRKEMLAQMKEQRGPNHYGEERFETDKEKALRILAEELKRRCGTEAQLPTRRKGDKQKVLMARRLRSETTMTLKWIAARLQMGTWTHVNHLLYWHRQKK